MHTGEPRPLRNEKTGEVYLWEIHVTGSSHMQLVSIDASGHFRFQINPHALVRDLHDAILGPNGYLDELRRLPNLQTKFDTFMQETLNYTVKL
jgi:hypothetical protein